MSNNNTIPEGEPAIVYDWIASVADRRGSHTAQIDISSGRRFTYMEMHHRVGSLASHLRSLGVNKGDRVAYLMLNSTDVFEVIFACWRLGAVAVALNWRLTPNELEFIVTDSAPTVVIHDRDVGQLVDALKPITNVSHWIETGADGSDSAYEHAVSAADPLLSMPEPPVLTDICMLMYSSGTTGRPKGVIITHQMETLNAYNSVASGRFSTESVSLCFLPLFHVAGVNGMVAPAFLNGATVAVLRAFDPNAFLSLVNDEGLGISHLVGVPAIFQALTAHPGVPKTDFSRIVTCFVGASAVPGPLIAWWQKHGLDLREGYGLTESAGSGISMPPDDVGRKTGVSGKTEPGFHLKIMREDRTEADIGEAGELWMRGPMVTPGYWNRPEANAESFVDGWFRTGDILSRDADGYFKVQDRLKDMYISGGENVYPAEVEDTLYAMAEIAEVAVIGIPDERWGEVGCAVAVLKPDAELSIDKVLDFIGDKLAKYKRPTRIEIVDILPRTASGKVMKNVLRDRFIEG